MPQTSNVIEYEAAKIGKMATNGEIASNDAIQVLSGLLEYLAANIQRLERACRPEDPSLFAIRHNNYLRGTSCLLHEYTRHVCGP